VGVLGLTEADVCFSAAKLFFAYGLGNALTFPMSVGATTLLMGERPTPDATFRRWRGEVGGLKPTVFFGAPTGFAGMLAQPGPAGRDEVSLRLVSSAGEALPAELGERFKAHFGVDIVDGIGSTEMLHIFISNLPDPRALRQHRLGGAGLRDRAARRRRQAACPTARSATSTSRGPSAAMMYWGNRTKTRETFQGGWTKSGDKYVRNDDGSYTYSGRSDDMLKVSGIYVSPFEVEATLVQHAAVLEAAVIGVPDAEGLTKTKAFVVLKPGAEATADELKAFVKDKLAPTSTRARSSSWPNCPRPPPARSSASSCATRKGRMTVDVGFIARLVGRPHAAHRAPLAARERSSGRCWSSCTKAWARCRCGATSRRGCADALAAAAWSIRAPVTAAQHAACAGRGLGPDFMHRQAHEVLPALLQALGIDTAAPPWLFGHSDGGSIALLYARASRRRWPARWCWRRTSGSRTSRWPASPRRARPTPHTDLRQRLARHHDDPDSAFFGWNDIWLRPDFRAWSIEARLTAITCPLLAVQGLDDEYGTLEQVRGIARHVPQTQLLELPACGHSPHRDQPEAVIEAVRAFIARWMSPLARLSIAVLVTTSSDSSSVMVIGTLRSRAVPLEDCRSPIVQCPGTRQGQRRAAARRPRPAACSR
jgi:pimeloyl-ACP methyl ester carboxylesterase